MESIGYIASVFVGVILGVLGGGGSILSIPILVYLFRMDAVTASAYSLFIVGITSLVGAIPKYREHLVNIRTAIVFGLPSLIMIFATRKWIIPSIPDELFAIDGFVVTKRMLLLGIFALLMILASVAMIRPRGVPESEADDFKTGWLIAEGTLIGFLTGLVGAGGGFLIIPALVLLTGLPFKTAVGTSLFIIAINSLTGFLGDVLNYRMDWIFLFSITAFAICGIFIGNAAARKLSAENLRLIFGYFILVMGSGILIRELFYP